MSADCGVMGLVGVINQRHDHRHRRGDQRNAQVLDDRDHAVVATELASDGDQARRAACDQRQRAGQRTDVAVRAEQRTGGDTEDEGGDGHGQHDRPVRTQRADRVAMNHGADVDAQHALGRDTDPAGYPVRREPSQGQHDPDDQCGEQGGGRDAEPGQPDGGADRHRYQ